MEAAANLKRLRIQVYTRQARRDGLLHTIGPGRTVKETLKGVKKMTGLETLQSLWTTDGFRLDPRGETWQLVDHDAVLIASDRATFPAAASEAGTAKPRKRQPTSTTTEDDGVAAPAAKKVKKASSTDATEPSPPAAAASDGGVSAEYQQFLATEGKALMAQFRLDNPHQDPRNALRSVAAAWQKHPSNPKNSHVKDEEHSPTQISQASSEADSSDEDDGGQTDGKVAERQQDSEESDDSDSSSESDSESL